MLVTGFPADAFGTNCYVLAAGPGEQCLVVDPGIGVLDRLEEVLKQHRLHPAAVLLTHGHLDHTFSVAPVCGARGIPAWIHPDDEELLHDPGKALSMSVDQLINGISSRIARSISVNSDIRSRASSGLALRYSAASASALR